MKCDNCEYCEYDRADDMYLCRFGWDCEDFKGNCGCRYNKKTLDKIYRESMKKEAEFWEKISTELKINDLRCKMTKNEWTTEEVLQDITKQLENKEKNIDLLRTRIRSKIRRIKKLCTSNKKLHEENIRLKENIKNNGKGVKNEKH